MKIAFIMDPLHKVKPHKDTSYFLMLASTERGHQVFYLDQNHLFWDGRRLQAEMQEVTVSSDHDHPFDAKHPKDRFLDEMDVVVIRTDPPFDRRYFYTTLLLDLLPPTTKVVNRPQGLRNWNEKLAAFHYPDLTPESLVTNDPARVLAFMERLGTRITVKPVDGHGGRGIFFLDPGATNNDMILAMLTHDGSHQIIAQAYVREAGLGDKRILLLNGEPMGGVLRVHAEGKELNNFDAGGSPHPLDMNDNDLKICAAVKDGLVREGIVFAGIDILGDRLIEINVTSPTGLQEMCRFTGVAHHHSIIAAFEAMVHA